MLSDVDTASLDLNMAGCTGAQTLDRTVTFSQAMDNTSYLVALSNLKTYIGYTEIQQTAPQTGGGGQFLSFTVALKSKTTTSLTLTFTLSANTCIGTLGVNLAMVNHPLIDAGIVYIDTSATSTELYYLALNAAAAASAQTDVTLTFTVPAKSGSLYIRSWLVGWTGTWASGSAGNDPGI